MSQLVSKYKNNSLASKKKHIYSRLLDYFSIFVLAYLLFNIFYMVSLNFPVMTDLGNRLSNINGQVAEYIDSTHLQRLKSDKSGLISLEESANEYAKAVSKTSAYINNLPFPVKNDDGTYSDVAVLKEETFVNDLTNYSMDPLTFYFYKFKAEDPSLNNYDGYTDKEQYLFKHILTTDDTKFVSSDDTNLVARGEGISKYNVLTVENTQKMLKYYRGDTLDTSIHELLYTRYINAVQKGIKDVEAHSTTYLAYIDLFNKEYQNLTGALLLIYLISYTVAYIALTLILALISKEWVTIGQKVMSQGICDTHENEPRWWNILIYHLLNYVLFFSSSALGFYFMGLFGVLSFKILPHISVLTIDIAILTLNIFSLFMPLFNKNRFNLSTLISRVLVKDKKEFEGSVEAIIASENIADGSSTTSK